jgi:predicted nuclease with TOPRIM domain
MENLSCKINIIGSKLKTLSEENKKLSLNLSKVKEKQEKLEKLYTKLIDKINANSISIEELDVDIARLKETKYRIDHYEDFKIRQKKGRVLQIAIVMGICAILTSPLIGINAIAYLELILLSTAFITLSNVVKYFNDISPTKELVKSTNMNVLIQDIDEKEKQREITDCINIKLGNKKMTLANEIDNLNAEKEHIFDRLEYLDDYKKGLIEKLLKEVEQNLINSPDQLDNDELSETGSCLKLESK